MAGNVAEGWTISRAMQRFAAGDGVGDSNPLSGFTLSRPGAMLFDASLGMGSGKPKLLVARGEGL